jgi:hypothetical protein
MMTAVFGDFLGRASDHVTAAVSIPDELPDDVLAGIIGELSRLTSTLTGYLGDMLPPAEFAPATAARGLAPDMRAVLNTRIAMRRAAQSLRPGRAAIRSISVDGTHPVIWHLSNAATHLAAGRDLLQTHFASSPSGVRDGTSSWAAALTSGPVTSALLARIGGIAAELAPWTSRVSLDAPADRDMPAAVRFALHSASSSLWKAGATTAAFARQQPPTLEGHLVLAAIPANIPPPRCPVTGPESTPDLCGGITATAERLRHAAIAPAHHARWSPHATAANWRRDALASAVSGHSSELVLRALVQRAGDLGVDSVIEAWLAAAASAVNQAWTAWRTLTDAWDLISTNADKAACVSPVAAETSDLALRMGRLAYQDPGWTPACGSISRDPAALAPSANELRAVLAAVHHATDAISRIATQDGLAVRAAAASRRLYMPTRLVPARSTTPHPYSPAPSAQVNALLAGYDRAVRTSATATTALDSLVLIADAPSRPLALARRFAQASNAPAPDTTTPRRVVEIITNTTAWPTPSAYQPGRGCSR